MRQPRRAHTLQTLEKLERRTLFAVAIAGVQPLAIETPHLNALLRRTIGGAPLTSGSAFRIDTRFNTASPAIVLDAATADALAVQRGQTGGIDSVFSHDHAGGSIDFNISESLNMSLASNDPAIFDIETNTTHYDQDSGLRYMEIGSLPTDQSIVGPEAVIGRVVVIDPRPPEAFQEAPRAYVESIGTPSTGEADAEPGIPAVSHHLALSYGDYSRFTHDDGAANVPNLHRLIFVGPNPIDPTLPDNTPPVSYELGVGNGTGSFLFDTGAAASMLSLAKAAALGVTYQPGTFNTAGAALLRGGAPVGEQFRVTVQSLAGPVTLAGFYLDSLTLPALDANNQSDPIEFTHIPVLVGDVALGLPEDPDRVTLDGVLGMNLFGASVALAPNGTASAWGQSGFNWVVFDEPNKTLGLDVASLGSHPHVLSSSFNFQGDTQSVSFQFTGDIIDQPLATDLTLTNLASGQSYYVGDPNGTVIDVAMNGTTATFTFTSFPNGMLPDGAYSATINNGAVHDETGAGLFNFQSVGFFSYQGDANHDGAVNALDFNALAGSFGQADAGFDHGDFNYDGLVNSGDFTLLSGRFNQRFAGPDAPDLLFAPAGATAAPSGPAAPAPVAGLFSEQPLQPLPHLDLDELL